MTIKYYQSHQALSRGLVCGKPYSLRLVSAFFYGLSYNLSWLPFRLFGYFFLNLKVETKENLRKLRGPLIIASNHASRIDPFLIGAIFPFMSKVYPIRFACWYKYFYSRYAPFIIPYGAFPVRRKIGLENVLKVPLDILRNNGVVGIFPEGKMTAKKGRKPRGRRGAAYLAIKTGTKILPIKIEGNEELSLKKSLLRKNRVTIKIGKPFYLSYKENVSLEELNQASDFVVKKIREF